MADCGGNLLQVGQKYGGLAPKKKPLIAKDNERAFFDSADWALCKQGSGTSSETSTVVAMETLQPKLQRTPHQQLPPRRPACTSTTTTTNVNGKADVDAPYLDVGNRGSSGTSPTSSSSSGSDDDTSSSHHADDPAQIVARALVCFNDRKIYRTCDEDYRLNESGRLSVPLDQVDAYCGGPCFSETNLVLDCVEGIMENFVFYNTATIEDVKDTMKAGCSDGPDRGNFDVSEHLQASQSTVVKSASGFLFLSALVSAIAAAQAW